MINQQFFKIKYARCTGLCALFCLVLLITACSSMKKPALDPASQDFYNYAHYLFTKEEAQIFKNLRTSEARKKFIENFWEIRDPDPSTDINEFREEIIQRTQFAVRYLKEQYIPGWKTDRGMIYIVLGPPVSINEDTAISSGRTWGYIYWYYGMNPGSNLYVRFVDKDGLGVYRIDPMHSSMELLKKMEDMKYQVQDKDSKKSIFQESGLNFDLAYEADKKSFFLPVEAAHVTFERKDGKVIAQFKITLVLYRQGEAYDNFQRFTKSETLELTEDEVMAKKSRIMITFPLEIAAGTYKIDALLTDMLGEKSKRKFFTIKVH